MDLQLTCKAASPDNDREIRDIIALFRQVHGDNYPFQNAYQPAYWRQHIGRRFVSIVLYSNNEMIGHLAYQREGRDQRMVQILFPLSHPRLEKDRELVSRELWAKVEGIAQIQRWRGFYFSALADDSELVRYSEKVLNASPIALCPGYSIPNTGLSAAGTARDLKHISSTDILVTQRLISPSAHKPHSIFISEERGDLVRKLYHSLGILRDVRSEASQEKLQSYPLPADRPGLETRLYPSASMLHAYIEPSLLRSQQELKRLIPLSAKVNTFALVKGYDPRAIETEDWLMSHGFEFAGVLPFIHDRESLLFTKSREDQLGDHLHAESILLHGIQSK